MGGDSLVKEACSPAGYEFEIFSLEMVGTFIFVAFVLTVKKYNPTQDGIIGSAACAATLYGMIKMVGGLTGGCLNPMVGICQTVFAHIIYAESESSLALYAISTLIGGGLAGLFILAKLNISPTETESYKELGAPESENFIQKNDAAQNI